MHTILASRYLTDHNYGRRDRGKAAALAHGLSANGNGNGNGTTSGQATPQTMTVNNMWRNSARTIGDILVLSDIINPFTYVALPFVNQAFYVAGSCYVKGMSSHVPSCSGACERLLTSQRSSSTTSRSTLPTPLEPNEMPNKPNFPVPSWLQSLKTTFPLYNKD
jgi:hypothetical protein